MDLLMDNLTLLLKDPLQLENFSSRLVMRVWHHGVVLNQSCSLVFGKLSATQAVDFGDVLTRHVSANRQAGT
jgi:type 1 fimbria pilin